MLKTCCPCIKVDGHLTAWTHWSHCSATCEGTSKRTRVCHPPVHGGAPCVGDTSEISRCGTLHCPGRILLLMLLLALCALDFNDNF